MMYKIDYVLKVRHPSHTDTGSNYVVALPHLNRQGKVKYKEVLPSKQVIDNRTHFPEDFVKALLKVDYIFKSNVGVYKCTTAYERIEL